MFAFFLSHSLVKATRMSDKLTVIVVTWTVTDEQVTKLSLEMREGDGGWSSVPGATDMSTSTTEFKVENLKADKKYTFRLDMRRPGEERPSYVESNTGRSGQVIHSIVLRSLKVIPQKLKLTNIFFLTFHNCSLPVIVLKKAKKPTL